MAHSHNYWDRQLIFSWAIRYQILW